MGRVYEAFTEKIETPPAEGEASKEKSEIFSQYSASQGECQGRFHLYQADTFQDQYSNSFPRVCEVTSVDDLIAAARYDHIAGCCERGHRGAADFIQADCVISDVDNGKHDKGAVELPETEWKTPADVKARFPGVSFYVVYSRHDGIQRPGKEGEPNDSPRPRFKAYFPLATPVTTKSGYDELQEKLSSCFPEFDSGAVDCVHLMYGVKNPRVEYYTGDICIDDYLREVETAKRNISHFEGGSGELVCDALKHIDPSELSYDEWIHVGMALHAEGIPFDTFDEWSSQDPRPKMYSRQNCETHWRSFTSISGGYTGGTIVKMAKDRGWQPASQRYEGDGCLDWDSVIGDPGDKEIEVVMPKKDRPAETSNPITEVMTGRGWNYDLHPGFYDDTDSWVCSRFVNIFRGYMWHSPQKKWLVYSDGMFTPQADARANQVAFHFIDRMFRAALDEYNAAQDKLRKCDGDIPEDIQQAADNAEAFLKFAKGRRSSISIKNFMELVKSEMFIDYKKLDADPFLLNCPDGVIDLRTGQLKEHSHKYLVTRTTAYSPCSDSELDSEGAKLWYDFLDKFCGGDTELQRYFQTLAGMWAVGRVEDETATFFTGGGGNGKSTALGAVLSALGDYGTKMSADILTRNYRGNAEPQLVRLNGMRLCLVSEFTGGNVLNDGMLKQLTSTDRIIAAGKYLAPEEFEPTHSLVIMTNDLPAAKAFDPGTRRRICIFPCEHTFTGSGDIKNYKSYMLEHGAGPVIMRWIVEGAVEYLAGGLNVPAAVKAATDSYWQTQEWIDEFIDDCLEPGDRVSTGEVYEVYEAWCFRRNEHPVGQRALEARLKEKGINKDYMSKRDGQAVTHYYAFRDYKISFNGASLLCEMHINKR